MCVFVCASADASIKFYLLQGGAIEVNDYMN